MKTTGFILHLVDIVNIFCVAACSTNFDTYSDRSSDADTDSDTDTDNDTDMDTLIDGETVRVFITTRLKREIFSLQWQHRECSTVSNMQ